MKKLSRQSDMGAWDSKRKSGWEGLVRPALSLGHNTATHSSIQDRPQEHLFLVDSSSGPGSILCSLLNRSIGLRVFQGRPCLWRSLTLLGPLIATICLNRMETLMNPFLLPAYEPPSHPCFHQLLPEIQSSQVIRHHPDFLPIQLCVCVKSDLTAHASLIVSLTSSETHGLSSAKSPVSSTSSLGFAFIFLF